MNVRISCCVFVRPVLTTFDVAIAISACVMIMIACYPFLAFALVIKSVSCEL